MQNKVFAHYTVSVPVPAKCLSNFTIPTAVWINSLTLGALVSSLELLLHGDVRQCIKT